MFIIIINKLSQYLNPCVFGVIHKVYVFLDKYNTIQGYFAIYLYIYLNLLFISYNIKIIYKSIKY